MVHGNEGDGLKVASETSKFASFMDALEEERQAFGPPGLVREQAETFIRRTLAFLFPHFEESGHEGHSLSQEYSEIELILNQVVAPLLGPNDSCVSIDAKFRQKLPLIRELLLEDARAIFENDPAAESTDEVILAYPGFLAIAVHRVAHAFYECGVPFFPRLLGEYAHRMTGVDIHPGAKIGRRFSIDHGTGIVIGETTVIGDRVRIFQGVTLGALSVDRSLTGTKRHPTIGNDVVIYAGATILGGDTVIGDGSVIGGNVWLTRSVVPRTAVTSTTRKRVSAPDDSPEYHI